MDNSFYCFIQYFYEPIFACNDEHNLLKPLYPYENSNLKVYELYRNAEVFLNTSQVFPYKSYFYVSYHYINDIDDIDDFESKYGIGCSFEIYNISDFLDDIIIQINNYCSATQFHYYVFITSNTSNTTNYFNDKNPIELFYEKDKNKSLKYYEFTTEEDTLEIYDTFEKGLMNITIVGIGIKGYKSIAIDKKENNYVGNKKSYTTYIIIGCIGGAIVSTIIICIVVKQIKKRIENNFEQKQKILVNQVEEKAKKNQIGSADFAGIDEEKDD